MDVLVLGGSGMLGHKIFQHLKVKVPNTWCTIHHGLAEPRLQPIDLLHGPKVIQKIDALDFCALKGLLLEHQPRVIVNCIGVIKQRAEAKAAIPSISLNALLPHRLAGICQQWNGRLIHFSTDCVFSGKRGGYSEDDFADADDLYGRTKFLGEVKSSNALTLRTSIIGRELTNFNSLLEWFLGQNHLIAGYARAFYSGVTTNYLAELVGRLIEEQPRLSGLYQVTGQTISKFDLLCLLRNAFGKNIDIVRDEKFFCDRSMKGERFVEATGYRSPGWPDLVAQLVHDETPYEDWRIHAHQTV